VWTLVRYPFQRGQRKERLVILRSFSHDPRSVLALVKRGNGGQCCLTHHWRRGHRFGRYEILAELGRGTMGVVYKPHDPKINRVAVKTVSLVGQPPEEEREYRQRFFREAEDAGCLSHPGIVPKVPTSKSGASRKTSSALDARTKSHSFTPNLAASVARSRLSVSCPIRAP